MLKSATLLVGSLALTSGALGQSAAQVHSIPARAPIHAGTFYAATGEFVPAERSQQAPTGVSDIVYNNNYYGAVFVDINGSNLVVDEGRIPSTTSPTSSSPVSFTGVADNYRINTIQLGYATNSDGEGNARLTVLSQYDSCASPLGGASPVLDLIITGLPGTILSGAITPYTFDVDMTGFEFCMPADGDGQYDGVSDSFGFGLLMSADAGSMIGPLLAARPGPFAPTGDGTVFQNPGDVGSGLDAEDQWFDLDLGSGAANCFNAGGYDPITNSPPFGSFWMVMGADLNFDCFGCAANADDALEQNDDCASAVSVGLPSQNFGLVVTKTDPDYYSVDIPAESTLTVATLFSQLQADVDLRLLSDDCATVLDASLSTSDDEQVSLTNCTTSPLPVKIYVEVWSGSSGDCSDYELIVSSDSICADDPLELNNDCASAYPLSIGTTINLKVTECDQVDYFDLSLEPGESIDVVMTLDPSEADLDLELYTNDGACDSPAGLLDFSYNLGGTESIAWENATGQHVDYVLKVTTFSFESGVNCTGYVLDYQIGASTDVGTNFCSAVLNSTGLGAHISGSGSDEVADNDFTLNADYLPENSSGYFFVSQGTFFVPNVGSSSGNLCIGGGPVGRFLANVLNTGPGGSSVSLLTDLTALPQPTAAVVVLPGDSYNFQYWYRDEGDTNNFSDALSVTFR